MSKPFVTQQPSLAYTGVSLIAGNGGFDSYSGTPDRYRFEFRHPESGAPSPLGNTDPDAPPDPDEYPAYVNANILYDALPGSWVVWVAAGIHSRYVLPDGTIAYDVIEWSDWAASNTVTVPERIPEPAPAPPPAPTVTLDAAQHKAVGALYELVEQWRRDGYTDRRIADTLIYQAIRALLVPLGTGKRAAVKNAIREVIDYD